MMVIKITQYFRQHIDISVSNNDSNILSWKSKGLSDESIKPTSAYNKMLSPSLNYVGTKARAKFKNKNCLNKIV